MLKRYLNFKWDGLKQPYDIYPETYLVMGYATRTQNG
jgi:hypothetical protein